MKEKNLTYWTATSLVCVLMAYSAILYLGHEPKTMAAFGSLGYPSYFPTMLGLAKLLGVTALLWPHFPRLKEWAYAGFTFTFIAATCSHLASGQPGAVVMPIVSLVVLGISYACRPAERRLPEAPAELTHRGGLPAR